MFNNELYNIPLETVLVALGSRKGTERNKWISPLHPDTDASLHVNPEKNVWFDFGLNAGGTNVDLIMRAKNCSKQEAYRFLGALVPSEYRSQLLEVHPPESPARRTLTVRCIQNRYLLNYLESRKIPVDLARRYLKEVIIYDHQQIRRHHPGQGRDLESQAELRKGGRLRRHV